MKDKLIAGFIVLYLGFIVTLVSIATWPYCLWAVGFVFMAYGMVHVALNFIDQVTHGHSKPMP